jgi:hypothetical protein
MRWRFELRSCRSERSFASVVHHKKIAIAFWRSMSGCEGQRTHRLLTRIVFGAQCRCELRFDMVELQFGSSSSVLTAQAEEVRALSTKVTSLRPSRSNRKWNSAWTRGHTRLKSWPGRMPRESCNRDRLWSGLVQPTVMHYLRGIGVQK